MKVRLFFLVVSLLVIGTATVFPGTLTAITEEGTIVTLKSDGTWEKNIIENKQEDFEVLDEKNLFNLVLKERDLDLCRHYLEHYEGVDLRNTIIVLFNKVMCLTMSTARPPLYREVLLKGIQYTYQYEKIFMLPWGAQKEMVSNLYFFWELANTLENDEQYEEALSFYNELKEIYVEIGMSHPYAWIFGENNIEEIDGKIYKMKYLTTL